MSCFVMIFYHNNRSIIRILNCAGSLEGLVEEELSLLEDSLKDTKITDNQQNQRKGET